jgi:predicted phosphodiesterase
MARIAVLSDIHGNLEALEAVLIALTSEQVDYVIHLGDLVGYNANPRECLQLLQRQRVISILGNHDLAALEPQSAEGFNVLAYQAIKYVQTQLTAENLRYLRSLPRIEVLWDRFLICHGTPESLDTYILNLFQAKRIFNLLRRSYAGIRICFFGHTHMQKLWLCDARGKVTTPTVPPSTTLLDADHLYLINPGSVGQPRQQDNRAHYLIFDADRENVSFKAVAYDIHKAQEKIRQARLPEYLASRLEDGI